MRRRPTSHGRIPRGSHHETAGLSSIPGRSQRSKARGVIPQPWSAITSGLPRSARGTRTCERRVTVVGKWSVAKAAAL
jgi:hypothetical protein